MESPISTVVTLADFSEPKLLVPRLLSDHQAGAIQELARRLEKTERIWNASAFMEAVLRREAELPTMLGQGLVVPHARGQAARTLSLAAGLSAGGIRWGADRENLVNGVFLFAVPLTNTPEYLAALAALSRFIQEDTVLDEFRQCRQPEEMFRVLQCVELPDLLQPLTDRR